MSENTALPADAGDEGSGRVSRQVVVAGGLVATVGLAAAGYLLLPGGQEAPVVPAPTSRPAAAAPALSASASPSSEPEAPRRGSGDPFRPLVAGGTARAADAAAGAAGATAGTSGTAGASGTAGTPGTGATTGSKGSTPAGTGPTTSGTGPAAGSAGSTAGGAGATAGGTGATAGGRGSTASGTGSTSGGAGPTAGGPGATTGGTGPTAVPTPVRPGLLELVDVVPAANRVVFRVFPAGAGSAAAPREYRVRPGQRFAQHFTLLSFTTRSSKDQCGSVLFVDRRVRLCEGDTFQGA